MLKTSLLGATRTTEPAAWRMSVATLLCWPFGFHFTVFLVVFMDRQVQALRKGLIQGVRSRDFGHPRARILAQGMERKAVSDEKCHLQSCQPSPSPVVLIFRKAEGGGGSTYIEYQARGQVRKGFGPGAENSHGAFNMRGYFGCRVREQGEVGRDGRRGRWPGGSLILVQTPSPPFVLARHVGVGSLTNATERILVAVGRPITTIPINCPHSQSYPAVSLM